MCEHIDNGLITVIEGPGYCCYFDTVPIVTVSNIAGDHVDSRHRCRNKRSNHIRKEM